LIVLPLCHQRSIPAGHTYRNSTIFFLTFALLTMCDRSGQVCECGCICVQGCTFFTLLTICGPECARVWVWVCVCDRVCVWVCGSCVNWNNACVRVGGCSCDTTVHTLTHTDRYTHQTQRRRETCRECQRVRECETDWK